MAFGCVFFDMLDRGYTKLPTKYKQVNDVILLKAHAQIKVFMNSPAF